ncbi:hypothetical protein XU42_26135 [Salmonella enterica]|nr:hypothetical protein [Salmonella enterica]
MTQPRLIVNLTRDESRISDVMAGPWQDIRLERLSVGQPLELASADAEHAGFVVRGTGELTSASGEAFAMATGMAFAIPAGGSVTVRASEDLEFLHVIMNLEH